MIRLNTVFLLVILAVTAVGCASNTNDVKSNSMIRHTVFFKLKHPKGSPEEKTFLQAAEKLSSIPGVKNFESLKQVSKKNNFDFGLSMEFDNQQNYDAYSNHPDHNKFVQDLWLNEVQDFLEIDTEPLRLEE